MDALSMDTVEQYQVPEASVALWWLGQASFLVKSPGGVLVALDPYLTNSCKAVGEAYGYDMDRRVPPLMAPADLVGIDAYVVTHSHQDHLDPDTLQGFRAAGGRARYVAPADASEKLQALGVAPEEIEDVWPNRAVTLRDLTVRATLAIPPSRNDLTHVGYLMSVAGGPSVYFTGDTDYHEVLGECMAEDRPDVLVAVINGAFRNLSAAQAATLAKQIDPKVVIPCHHDLFPDNSLPPRILRTNLQMHGMGDRYRELKYGVPYVYPET